LLRLPRLVQGSRAAFTGNPASQFQRMAGQGRGISRKPFRVYVHRRRRWGIVPARGDPRDCAGRSPSLTTTHAATWVRDRSPSLHEAHAGTSHAVDYRTRDITRIASWCGPRTGFRARLRETGWQGPRPGFQHMGRDRFRGCQAEASSSTLPGPASRGSSASRLRLGVVPWQPGRGCEATARLGTCFLPAEAAGSSPAGPGDAV
jgi:hypothetical protein